MMPCLRRWHSRSRLAGKPGKFRRMMVSALTKPEDAFAQRDPRTMTGAEFDRWYCSAYVSCYRLPNRAGAARGGSPAGAPRRGGRRADLEPHLARCCGS